MVFIQKYHPRILRGHKSSLLDFLHHIFCLTITKSRFVHTKLYHTTHKYFFLLKLYYLFDQFFKVLFLYLLLLFIFLQESLLHFSAKEYN